MVVQVVLSTGRKDVIHGVTGLKLNRICNNTLLDLEFIFKGHQKSIIVQDFCIE